MSHQQILLVEDNPGDAVLLQEALARAVPNVFEIQWVDSLQKGLEAIAAGSFATILLDLSLPESHGLQTIARVRAVAVATPIVVLTGLGDESVAMEAVCKGADDYLAKGETDGRSIARAIRYAIDRRQAQVEKEKLEATNRQLQKSESLGRMAGAIAHHFNNQFQVVSGNLELALLEPPATERSRQFLQTAIQATRRASEVSSGMLTYLGRAPGLRKYLDLAEACRKTLPVLQVVVQKNVTVETDFPSPGPIVHADGSHLLQVLTSLVTNACEAAGTGNAVVRVSVTTALRSDIAEPHRFPIDAPPRRDAYACLQVTDTGEGIAPDDIDKIFDPFFSTRFSGRGLGLSAVLGIVRASEGVVTVESQPGRGSTFRVYFPLKKEEDLRPAKRVADAPAIEGTGTVLLVEDEDMVRTVTAMTLVSLGYTVLATSDGVEAVATFQAHRDEIRCVLCDLTMPRMDGWGTLTALRKIAPGIPLIIASGHSETQAMNGEHAERPNAFLSKPYGREDLGRAIRQALAGKRPG